MKERQILREVVSLPTAPLHEERVQEYIRNFAHRFSLICRKDKYGNLFVSNRGSGAIRLIGMAHMDHPGVEIISLRGSEALVRVCGGLYKEQLSRANLRFFSGEQEVCGKAVGWRGELLRVKIAQLGVLSVGDFGMLDITPVKISGDTVEARVIDNLAGCAALLAWLHRQRKSKHKIQAIFTRGEEIGFVGAKQLVRAKTLPRNIPLVVLETSSAAAVASVEIGNGPVLRVGDRYTTFDPRVDSWLQTAALQISKKNKKFKMQRALMTGGAMEATVYVLDGLMVGSIALPLGNYHNRGKKGPAPEYVSWRDFVNLGVWLDELIKIPSPSQVVRERKKNIMMKPKAGSK